MLSTITGHKVLYNTSPLDLRKVLADPTNVRPNLQRYVAGFSDAGRDVMRRFGFDEQVVRLDRAGLLYLVLSKCVDIAVRPHTHQDRVRDPAHAAHFYKYVPPRPLAEIGADIKALGAEIQSLLREVTECSAVAHTRRGGERCARQHREASG